MAGLQPIEQRPGRSQSRENSTNKNNFFDGNRGKPYPPPAAAAAANRRDRRDKVLPSTQTNSQTNTQVVVDDTCELADILGEDPEEDQNCPVCREDVEEEQAGILCEMCKTWAHSTCLHMTEFEFNTLVNSPQPWYCMRCLSIKANKIKWGKMEGEENIKNIITSVYKEVSKWHKNLFLLPRGKVGCEFIKELTKLLNLFVNNDKKWGRVALALLHIFIPLMLQKPSAKSKAKENSLYLQKRLQWWIQGDLNSLLAETRVIQTRLKKKNEKKQESKQKAFCRLMLLGKVSKAMNFINNDDITLGVHPITDEIKQLLREKHPVGKPAEQEILLPDIAETPQPVIFEGIDAESVYKAAKKIQGSGGPSLIDADGWRHILCSKSYGKTSVDLCESIANLAKKLCREEIHPDSLHEFVACRLIPLDKGNDVEGNPGIRPIGIGEILRRIVGKVVVSSIKEDIIDSAGPLQTCAGLMSGIEASIHAMRTIFEDKDTEGILLVDAENAFNNLNRKAAIHNIKQLCPPFHRFLANTYQLSAELHINNDDTGSECIMSDEGSTQGDVAAMGMYAIGTRPLINILAEHVDNNKCKQAWYADDSSSGVKLLEMRKWWDVLNTAGPKFGYFPKPSKTILILKDASLTEQAREIFANTGIKITVDGERHLGAVIGSPEFREEYVKEKIDNWVKDVEHLSEIAKDEPQFAHSAFTKALCMRWSFLQRTIPDVSNHFVPLEEVIREKLIPAIIGRKVTDIERRIIAQPVRFGGLGILSPVETADWEYKASVSVTRNLVDIILRQEQNLVNYNKKEVHDVLSKTKSEKEERLKEEHDNIIENVNDDLGRLLKMATEKGAGSWLTALPMQVYGYDLNKQEFRDAICLRYGWRIPGTPSYCICNQKNTVDHILNCKHGGFVIMRHNEVRDIEAEFLRDICKDVMIEPELLPVGNTITTGNTTEKARLDVSSVGLHAPLSRNFLDVRVSNFNSPVFKDKTPEQIYKLQEREKKYAYNQRVIQVEKGTFTPLIFSTTGGMGPEATKYHKRVAEVISKKKKEDYADVMKHIRTRIRFAILRGTLIAIRGDRGRKKRQHTPISDLAYNLIPDSYEIH